MRHFEVYNDHIEITSTSFSFVLAVKNALMSKEHPHKQTTRLTNYMFTFTGTRKLENETYLILKNNHGHYIINKKNLNTKQSSVINKTYFDLTRLDCSIHFKSRPPTTARLYDTTIFFR